MERAVERQKKHRSPNYPALSLPVAIDKVRTLYDFDKRNPTPPEVIAKHLGYGPTSGSGKRVLSALKAYGLLEERAGSYRVSDLAIKLLHLPEGHPDRPAALQEAALGPEIFREMLAKYKDGLPSDETLKAELITQRGFNPASVEEFVRNVRETVKLAQLSPGEGFQVAPTSIESTEAMGEPSVSVQPISPQVRFYRWAVSIPRGITAELRIFGQELRREDVQRIKKQLELLEEAFIDEQSGGAS